MQAAKTSLVTSQLDALDREGDKSEATLDDMKGAATMAYFGGAETTSSALPIFIFAMILYP